MALTLGAIVPTFGGEQREVAAAPIIVDPLDFKFTPTLYRTTNEPAAFDLNLRGNVNDHTAWVGYYQQHALFRQARLGYEYALRLPFGRAVLSGQYATRGFFGGSVTGEIGRSVYAIIGWGRTNLKPYFNLNFDPNDAVTLGAGVRLPRESNIALFQVRDDRLATGQRITHLVFRTRPTERTRWTVDIFHRAGWNFDEEEPQPVRGTGLGIGYDFDPYFVRVVWDAKVNFTRNDMLRVAAGWRF